MILSFLLGMLPFFWLSNRKPTLIIGNGCLNFTWVCSVECYRTEYQWIFIVCMQFELSETQLLSYSTDTKYTCRGFAFENWNGFHLYRQSFHASIDNRQAKYIHHIHSTKLVSAALSQYHNNDGGRGNKLCKDICSLNLKRFFSSLNNQKHLDERSVNIYSKLEKFEMRYSFGFTAHSINKR